MDCCGPHQVHILYCHDKVWQDTFVEKTADQTVDGCTNQTNIATDIGLTFDNYCLTNIPDYDLRNHDSNTLTDCLEACATSGADPG